MDLVIRLLGGFQVELDGREVHGFESDKARALLAYLAAESGRPHRRAQLAALLWSDFPEDKARRNLSQTLYNLRQTLDDRPRDQSGKTKSSLFETDNQCVGLRDGRVSHFDLAHFRAGLAGCPDHNPSPLLSCRPCRQGQEAAVKQYQGELLAGLSLDDAPLFDEWLAAERERLHRAALDGLIEMATWQRRQGHPQAAVTHARRAVELDPLWEPAQRQLMHALWQSGQRAEALAQYQACRRLLGDELGVEPDEQTQKLQRRILADHEVVSPRPAGHSNLPYHLTPFIGREQELREMMSLLSQSACRLLTLVGPGGSGKSRLAVEVVRRLAGDFLDGVYLASLSPLPDPAAIVPALTQLFQLPAQDRTDPRDQLLDFLREKKLLLIMDSFERLTAGAGLVVDILRQAAGVKVLVTSRVLLKAKGEHTYHVAGLELPDEAESIPQIEAAAAVRLFLSAAERAVPGYRPSEKELPAIVDICRLAEGMPLTIILASAWLKLYSPATIARQIEQSLDFLAVEWADLPPRQRSLRATLDYTWQLLDDEQQAALAGLSVFRGGFTAEAAAEVANLSGPVLLGLVDHSVIQRAGVHRFVIHDILRQYAAERLAEQPDAESAACRKHADYFTSLAAGLVADLKGAGQQAALDQLDADSTNLSAAWGWAAQNRQVEWLDRALEGVGLFCELLARPREGRQACELAVELLAADFEERTVQLARAKSWQARFSHLLGQDSQARSFCTKCRELLAVVEESPAKATAEAFNWLVSGDACVQTNREEAQQWYRQSLARYRELGDEWGAARVLAQLGQVSHLLGRYPEALEQFQESLALYEGLGDPRGIVRALVELGQNSLRLGQLKEGEKYIMASVDQYEQLGDRAGFARSLFNLGRVRWWLGEPHEFRRLMIASTPLFLELGLTQDAAFCLACTSGIYCILCDYDETITTAQRALAFAKEYELPRYIAFSEFWMGAARFAGGELSEARERLLASAALCREIGQQEELATSLSFLGRVELGAGSIDASQALILEALEITSQLKALYSAIFTLPMAALFLARQGHVTRALEVYSLINRYPAAYSGPILEDLAGRHIRELASEVLSPEEIEAAEARGRELELWPTVAELVEELS